MGPRFLLAGLVALAAAGCGGGEPAKGAPEPKLRGRGAEGARRAATPARGPPDEAADIERLLSERARALEAEDVLALPATATGRQRARDRRNARRTKRLGDRAHPLRGRRAADVGRPRARSP